MRIDAFTHFYPAAYYKRMEEVGTGLKDMFRRARAVQSIHDLDTRLRVIDQFPDYAQVISLPMPTLETVAKGDARIALELARIGNDGMAELVAKHPKQFAAFVAQAPLSAPDAGAAEAERAITQLGALGVQIYSNVGGKPLDRPEFEPFFAAMNRIGKPIWLHPARGAEVPDYLDEKKSLYEIWWTFGWPYETSVAMARLVFSKTLDKYPNLKIIAHHLGAMVPYHEGRVGPGWDQLGKRTTDEDYFALLKSLKKRPLDYFKGDFYAELRRVRLARGHHLRARLLRRRPRGVRLRLPVRPRGRPRLHPRDHQDPRRPRPLQGRPRQDLLRQPREAHGAEVRM